MSQKRIFGEIPGILEGTLFESRGALNQAGVHKPLVAGISGSAIEGADSIVVSGGYEDDEDLGSIIVYTGYGGNDPSTKKQIADQKLEKNNLALAISEAHGLPIRVIRGAQGDPATSPKKGYRYDGLYFVESHWQEVGKSGYKVFRYKLQKQLADTPDLTPHLSGGNASPKRALTTVLRIVRDTKVSQSVKALYDYKCQVCNIAISTSAGAYAEAAHIIPLGKPHNGPDVFANILCLCPNHHVSFDKGGFSINDDFSLINEVGVLSLKNGHCVSLESIRDHRRRFNF